MIEIRTLEEGGQTAASVLEMLAAFASAAERTLDIAVYELASPADALVDAVRAAASRGVRVRTLYDDGISLPLPRPPQTDPSTVAALGGEVLPVPGVPSVMHHTFVVRDADAVLTSSGGWSADAFERQEHVLATVRQPGVAAAYTRVFDELWTSGRVLGTGRSMLASAARGSIQVTTWFCPGRGRGLSRRIAGAISRSKRRVRICSPVVTAGPILGALSDETSRERIDLRGVYDRTAMDIVGRIWAGEPHWAWKIPVFKGLEAVEVFAGKPSGDADRMEAKIVVCDDLTFVGSYDLSRSGQDNAENMLEIRDPAIADLLSGFVDRLAARYAGA